MNKLMPVDWPDRLMSIIKASRLLRKIPKDDCNCKVEKRLGGNIYKLRKFANFLVLYKEAKGRICPCFSGIFKSRHPKEE
jgi:hypothetical protein